MLKAFHRIRSFQWASYLATLFIAIGLVGCGSQAGSTTSAAAANNGKEQTTVLKVGATAVPHAEILNFIKPQLKKEGVDLKVIEFNDYVQPNLQLASKQLDANYFQHIPYLDQFNKDHHLNLKWVTKVHIEPMGVYSKKYKSLDQIPNNGTIAIPNDVTNGGRALLLLADKKLIALKAGAGVNATVQDIVSNPKHLQFKELDAAMLPRVLGDVDAAVINTNYAIQAKLNPTKDALAIESANSPYANVLVVRPEDVNNPAIQKLAKALTSPEVKKFIEEKYKGAIVPAF
ncbi:MetQ/NlpA family ABC transporter substrate-binding protein [Fodinisporobacter ferrooxydans]|uniref:Lipoprotein n=1 Tax=Fodinisporobacter ferrooxydans TaxID=2901836 RepID=A0ABY4CSU4_9BACL|nr:MetQ/NlpA family ABC transporter substrate-binding protein [Alicyclobacillaceae bacterium MYW30-H2]